MIHPNASLETNNFEVISALHTVDTQQILVPFYKYLVHSNFLSKLSSCQLGRLSTILNSATWNQAFGSSWDFLEVRQTTCLFTTQTHQREKLQAGGKLKCLEARQRQVVEDETSPVGLAERPLHRASMLLSAGESEADTVAWTNGV